MRIRGVSKLLTYSALPILFGMYIVCKTKQGYKARQNIQKQLLRVVIYSEDTDRQYLKEINILQKCKAVAIAKERKKNSLNAQIFFCVLSACFSFSI